MHFVERRKIAEDGMLWASKGVVAALTAITPTVVLILSRGNNDSELDAQGTPMLDAIRVLVHAHTQLTSYRLLNIQKVVNLPLVKK